MPEEYRERPPTITAIQFSGGQECAAQINNWLSSYGGIVTYDAERERAIIETPASGYLTPNKVLVAENSDWVVLHRGGFIEVLKNPDFEFKYEPINGDVQTEEPPPTEEVPVEA